MNCPCSPEKSMDECCGPIIEGLRDPKTAEELMRSRYTAYTLVDMEYIKSTHDPKTIDDFDIKASKDWAQNSNWNGLDIISTSKGSAEDSSGTVEFKVRYTEKKENKVHHEISHFIKRNDKWFFSNGTNPTHKTFSREEPKIGRNDPCSCGSGKKYKKCCAN